MKKVEATFVIGEDGRSIVITPDEIKTNSVYKITLSGIKDEEGNVLPDTVLSVKTPYSPMYCSLESLAMIVDTFGIPEENLLMYIRQASKEADFIAGGTAVEDGADVSYPVEQYVRTKATFDCLNRAYMDRTYSGAGSKYTLDTATFEDSLNSTGFKSLLDRLGKELQKWADAIRGYYNEGRVKPKATRLGIKSSQNSDVKYTTVDQILQDTSRSMPQWS